MFKKSFSFLNIILILVVFFSQTNLVEALDIGKVGSVGSVGVMEALLGHEHALREELGHDRLAVLRGDIHLILFSLERLVKERKSNNFS